MYPLDRRYVAANIYSVLCSLRKTAYLLKVSHMTVARWLKCPQRKQYPQRTSSKSTQVASVLRDVVLADPFITFAQLQGRIKDTFGFLVSKELLRTVMKKQHLTRKKARFFSQPKGLEDTTKEFIEARDQYKKEGRLFVSVDETSFGRHGRQVVGFAPKGTRLVVRKTVPYIKTMSCVAAVTNNNILHRQQIIGSYNTERFLGFLESAQIPKGSVILLDNVRFHRSNVVKEIAEGRQWILLFTPPYSPWFNPIEGVFSIVKRHFYKGHS